MRMRPSIVKRHGHHLPGRAAVGQSAPVRTVLTVCGGSLVPLSTVLFFPKNWAVRMSINAQIGRGDHFAEDDEPRHPTLPRYCRNAAKAKRPGDFICARWIFWRRSSRFTPAAEFTASCRAVSAKATMSTRSSARLVDGSQFPSSKRATAQPGDRFLRASTVTPWASSPTMACCSGESALKATHFIELCDQARHPACSFCRTSPVYGRAPGRSGRTRAMGPKMVHAVANTRVPKLTVVIGGSLGR